MKRQKLLSLAGCLSALLTVACFALFMFIWHSYGTPNFWGSYIGMTEVQVRARIGEPRHDSRRDAPDKLAEYYTLKWSLSPSTGLLLNFKDGVVVSQERFRR